ncbi:MAG: hypothetical protein ACYCYF_05295 [Anaerolineae bacterium]
MHPRTPAKGALRHRLGIALVVMAGGLALYGGLINRRAPAVQVESITPRVAQAIATSTATVMADLTPTATVTASPRPTHPPTAIPLPTRMPTQSATHRRTRAPRPTATPAATPAPASMTLAPGAPSTRRQLPGVVMGPTVPPGERYRIGGLNMSDGTTLLSIAYPADYDSEALTRFDGLTILPVDFDGANYRRFVTDYNHYVFVYGDAPSGSFVLNVHDGTLRGSGRALEAEPLRRLIEGDLYAPYALDVIQANLARLVGREWMLAQNGLEVRFRLIKAARMNADDVAFYQDQAMMLSSFIGGMPDPRRSFLMFFCSGRQPGEPSGTFVGRYVLLLELVG